jgi:hypothetical protein
MGSAALLLGVFLAFWADPQVGPAAAAPAAADPHELPGIYECQGTGADGRSYRGAVIIEPDGNRFVVQWYMSEELTAVGLGIREGDMLAVSFFGADSGGIVLYRINGTRLIGHWSAPLTNGQIFEETLTRVANPPTPSKAPPSAAPSGPRRPPARPFGTSRPVRWLPDAIQGSVARRAPALFE